MLENNEEKLEQNVEEVTANEEAVTESVENISDESKQENEVEDTAQDLVKTEEVVTETKEEAKEEIPMLAYEAMPLESLTTELEKLLKNHSVQHIKSNVDAIKNTFNAKFGALLNEKKEAFLAEGGNSIDFQFSSPVKASYNKLLGDYKKKRDAYYNEIDRQLNENLSKRNQVIEDLKSLIENAEPKTMYNNFQQLQTRWKAIGQVPKSHYNDTWKIYHHHVERFYDLLHLNKDFRELDFKHNLEEKLKLIVSAEKLSEKEDIHVAFKELQELHRIWKEEIGPVAREHRENVWNKFSEATKKIHDKRHEYFRVLKGQVQEIITAKRAVIAEINAYDSSQNKTHKDWQKSIAEIEKLRKKYFDVGKLPYNKSEAVWQEFKAATKKFNVAKNIFYKQEKNVQNENLKKKMALVEIAESLKDSEDWDETTNTMKRIQADWRKIGHVPRKFSDDIWKRFKGACNHYFDRLHDRKNALNEEQQAIADSKKAFLEEFKTTEGLTLEAVKENITNWKQLGSLPRNARHLDDKFNKAVDKHLMKLDLNKEDIELIKFKNVIGNYLAQEDFRKLDSEQLFIRRKIDETVREMQQLENNLSFISNATEDNPLVKNVRLGIQNYKDELDIWQSKLNYLKTLDY